MAKAKVVKSKKGNDLVVLTLGPKEVATVIAGEMEGPYAKGIYDALYEVQGKTSNKKYLSCETLEPKITFKEF